MNKKSRQIAVRISSIILLAVLFLFINQYIAPSNQETEPALKLGSDTLEVYFIDVGQGDSILIETGSHSMLIDAGENNKGATVVSYLEAKNIKKLDYVIGTHPHSDHIGGLDTVIKSFPVDNIIMPPITHTTETFEDVLDAIDNKNLKITKAVAGNHYTLGPASFTIVSPNSSSYEDLNDYSVGILLTYGDNSFLLTGDAQKLSEEEMLANGIDLSADVIKLSHHGSAYSSSSAYLDAVNPTYAVISVGEDNAYGHPHAEVLQAMLDREIELYRTDKQGTVVFTSDGKTISVNTDAYAITVDDLESR